jgi:hypothetical protein
VNFVQLSNKKKSRKTEISVTMCGISDFTNVSEVLAASIIRAMNRNPEDSHIHLILYFRFV